MRLGVNIDHVATLRQARRGRYPDPVAAAVVAELGGADQITLHVREDRRHVNDRDLTLLRQTVNGTLNLEMAAVQPMVDLALHERPDTCTLVPERREELTTEGGLDAIGHRDEVRRVTRALRDGGIEVSLFIDPDLEQVKASHRADAQAVELHTGMRSDELTVADLPLTRQPVRNRGVMGAHDQGGAGLVGRRQQYVHDERAGDVVELSRRLVGEDERRARREHAGLSAHRLAAVGDAVQRRPAQNK